MLETHTLNIKCETHLTDCVIQFLQLIDEENEA